MAAMAVLLPTWWWAYVHLTDFADAVVVLAGLTRQTALGEALHFFCYDTPKVLLLLTGVVFVMGVVQTFFAPERTRALLAGHRAGIGNGAGILRLRADRSGRRGRVTAAGGKQTDE